MLHIDHVSPVGAIITDQRQRGLALSGNSMVPGFAAGVVEGCNLSKRH